MRVFLTGGSGMIGRPLVGRLRDRGDEVVVVSRSADRLRRDPFWRGVRVVPGDPSQAGDWQGEVSGADAVVNLAGHNIFAQRWNAAVRAQIRDSRVHAADQLGAAIAQARVRPAVFVQGSAIGYYGATRDETLTEAAPSGSDFLAVVCREGEDAARAVQPLGLRLAILRTGVVLGRGQGALGVMAPLFRWGGAGPIGSNGHLLRPARGQQWLSWIHLADIVGLFLLALDDARADGPINGTAPEPSRNYDFSRALAHAVHRPCLPVGPPDALVELLIGGVARSITTGQRVVPERALALGYAFRYGELDAAIRSALRGEEPSVAPRGRAAVN